MKTFFDYCETNYYAIARRIIMRWRTRRTTSSTHCEATWSGRGPVAKLRTVREPKEPTVIDGKLDEAYSKSLPNMQELTDVPTGPLNDFEARVLRCRPRGCHD